MVTTKPRILILDDTFPDPISGFRVAEYGYYFDTFPDVCVACSTSRFDELSTTYLQLYPEHAGRFAPLSKIDCSEVILCYVNFLNNACAFLPYIERIGAPFVFTLYPGGGFEFGSGEGGRRLGEVLRSSLLRGVVSTQALTTSILLQLDCPVRVYEIYGAAMNPIYFSENDRAGASERANGTINVCFAAYNYGNNGETKGFPEFLAAAESIASRFPLVHFTVVGNYDASQSLRSAALHKRVEYLGTLPTAQLRSVFLTQDIMVSPVRTHEVTRRYFDGFPTASCVEASLCGVAVITSDELGMNRYYQPDEMIICQPKVPDLIDCIGKLISNPNILGGIGARGRDRSMELFAPSAQLSPRARMLRLVAAELGVAV